MTIINKLGLGFQGDGFEKAKEEQEGNRGGTGGRGALGRVGEGKGGGRGRGEIKKKRKCTYSKKHLVILSKMM